MIRAAPIILEGDTIRLVPLGREHLDGLTQVGCDPDLWGVTVTDGSTPGAMAGWLETALAEQRRGASLAFATTLRQDGRVVGSTRFGNLDVTNRRVEIGWTFVAKAWQRSAVNTEAKYLMLKHAFETWGCLRVEFKTDALNSQSRAALARLGAKEEGTLRKHAVTWTGRVRDTVYFSVLDQEWPAVRARLEAKLARRDAP